MDHQNDELNAAISRLLGATNAELQTLYEGQVAGLEWTLQRAQDVIALQRREEQKRKSDSLMRQLPPTNVRPLSSSKSRNERVMECVRSQHYEHETKCWLWRGDFGGTLQFSLWATEDPPTDQDKTIYIVASPFDPSEVEPYDGERTLQDEKEDPAIWAPVEVLLLRYLSFMLQGWEGESEGHNKDVEWFCHYVDNRILKPAKALMLEPEE